MRIENLIDMIQATERCRADHVASTTVFEQFGNRPVWEGVVETFTLTGHPQKIEKCYGWSYQQNGIPKYVTVLAVPPVISPKVAVRLAIVSGQQT